MILDLSTLERVCCRFPRGSARRHHLAAPRRHRLRPASRPGYWFPYNQRNTHQAGNRERARGEVELSNGDGLTRVMAAHAKS